MRRNKLASMAVAALAVTAFAACGDDDENNNVPDPVDSVIDDLDTVLDEDIGTDTAVPGS